MKYVFYSLVFSFVTFSSLVFAQSTSFAPLVIQDTGKIENCGMNREGKMGVQDLQCDVAELKKCDDEPGYTKQACRMQVCEDAAKKLVQEAFELPRNILSEGFSQNFNTAREYKDASDTGSVSYTGIEKRIQDKKNNIPSGADIYMQTAWSNISAEEFYILTPINETRTTFDTSTRQYNLIMTDVLDNTKQIIKPVDMKFSNGTKNMFLSNDVSKPLEERAIVANARRVREKLNENIKIAAEFAKTASDSAATYDLGSAEYEKYRQESAEWKVREEGWHIATAALDAAINTINQLIAEKEGACLRAVQEELGHLTLKALGERTRSFNIAQKLSVGQEGKLTLLDTDPITGERSVFDKVIRFMAQITGTLAVLLIIVGAFLMIVARGSDALLTKGKNIVLYTLGGVVLVFVSYILVQFVISFLFSIG